MKSFKNSTRNFYVHFPDSPIGNILLHFIKASLFLCFSMNYLRVNCSPGALIALKCSVCICKKQGHFLLH